MKQKIIYTILVLVVSLNSYLGAQPAFIYQGGIGNGYNSLELEPNNNVLYLGAKEEAGYSAIYEVNNNVLFLGGNDDGYSSYLDYKDFIWTGAVGQSWTIAGNWNYNVVPNITRRTIIPSGVPAYPHINSGLFAIGDNPNNGAYMSSELCIMPGALLVTRVNCKVENYGLINVEGELKIRNSAYDAFVNNAGGQISIYPNGLFIFQ